MCGIAGILDPLGADVSPRALRAMADTLAHRGPDASSVWSEPGLGLAHTRLSIIDLAGSHQPMRSADDDWVIVFNGEIFNYRELRRALDYPFRTDGDTETILAGLSIHGIAFVSELRGQFALAAHQRSTGVTHLVRDRLGVLPLYYREEEGKVIFASEVKAINAVSAAPPAVDPLSLDAYLANRAVHAPFTMFEGVRKLPAAHRAEIARGGGVRLVRYWSAPETDVSTRPSEREVVDRVDDAVQDAVRAALVADVPVGAYLSGGVDSSLIVAVMKRLRGEAEVDTFAAGFGDPRFDELGWARRVSEHVGTRHHEVEVRAGDFEGLWSKLSRHRDAPVSEPADIAVFRLAEEARRHVRVVLSGEGGDELFAGYPKHRMAPWLAASGTLPGPLRRGLGGLGERMLPARLGRARIALRALAADTEAERIASWFSPFTAAERRALLGLEPPLERRTPVPPGSDAIDRMLRYDLAAWLPDNLLERGDRMSMAASLELRPPLLDHRLVELAFRLPSEFKVRRGVTKWALKEVARRYLPAEVVDRRKLGFRVPLDTWFRGELRDAARARLTDAGSFVAGVMDRREIAALLERHESGRGSEESRIWTLMSLEVWHESCVRGVGGRREVAA